ncbi:membrane protein [gut metagenome]|uniref:Membrane protein n=1 Tax=gut metagenome TaxID=749906 RepID=J9CUF4_9ZZZZ
MLICSFLDFINTFISLVVGLAYRLVDFCQFAQFFQVIVHLLVADDGQSHVILAMDVLVFVQYGFAVFVQFNLQAVGSLDCGYFDVVGLYIASFISHLCFYRVNANSIVSNSFRF